ncbi:MAG: Holliday junction branch migration protein RuvA [Lachnospiraceae bacterium]|nr:Holliday junction branch migration protein RuvA [Lachnospiraceae bacterium]MCR4933804.1 Holliday junction branch migration protein RuvA [Lachnospiraceae bacterium]
MIAFVKGILEYSVPGKVVVDVNGIGINVIVCDTDRAELPLEGNEVKLYTYLSVREDAMTLYGFLTKEALSLFNQLIGVSGVGPKGAQALIGAFGASMVKYYIVSEDAGLLSKAPGIGKKTAERIIIDLKDKIDQSDITLSGVSGQEKSKELPSEAKDACDALVALGYDMKAAKAAVMKVDNYDTLSSDVILKNALQYIFM